MNRPNRRGRKVKKRQLWLRSGGIKVGGEPWARCRYCQMLRRLCALTLDHVKPISKGGTNSLVNLVLACLGCNRDKGDNVIEF